MQKKFIFTHLNGHYYGVGEELEEGGGGGQDGKDKYKK